MTRRAAGRRSGLPGAVVAVVLAVAPSAALTGCGLERGGSPSATSTAATSTAATSTAATTAAAPEASSSSAGTRSAGTRATGTAAGTRRTARGLPAFVAVPPRATVTGSAAQRSGTRLAVSLAGRTALRPRPLVDFYTKVLTRAGFVAVAHGPGRVVFARHDGDEVLTLLVVDRGAARSFSVGGTVAA